MTKENPKSCNMKKNLSVLETEQSEGTLNTHAIKMLFLLHFPREVLEELRKENPGIW